MNSKLVTFYAIVNTVAANCGGGSNPTITIASQGDATALATCSAYSGTVLLPTNAVGNISISGLQAIQGTLRMNNVDNVTSLSIPSLTSVTEMLTVYESPNVESLAFPALMDVGTLHLSWLPKLKDLDLSLGIEKMTELYISNTNLSTLQGINVTTIEDLTILNNPMLKSVDMSDLKSATGFVNVEGCPSIELGMSNLGTVNDLKLQGINNVTLWKLNGSHGDLWLQNTSIDDFRPGVLETVGGSLRVEDNRYLTSLSLPALTTTANGTSIKNNSIWTADSLSIYLPSLVTPKSLAVEGWIKQIKLNSSVTVSDHVSIQPKNKDFDCSAFDKLDSEGQLGFGYVCNGTHASALSAGDKAGISVGAILAGVLLAGVIWYKLRRRNRDKGLTVETLNEDDVFAGRGGLDSDHSYARQPAMRMTLRQNEHSGPPPPYSRHPS